MPKLQPFIALIAIILFGAQSLNAQIFPFRNYSIEVGLSESVAHDLIQDDRGYIWVGTGYGLNRFNGTEFIQFYEEDGLANNRVNSLYSDSKSRVWIGTETGVSILRDDSLYTPDELKKLNEFSILAIHEDNEGNFWFGTDENGLWKQESDGQLQSVSDLHDISIQSVRAFDQSPDGTLWVAAREGVVRISDRGAHHYLGEEELPELRARDVKSDSQNRIWVATHTGLLFYENGEFEIYNQNHGLSNNSIHTITIENDNRIWLGTEEGVSLFEGGNFTNFSRQEGLPATIIYSSTLDTEGNLWFGTLGGGISIYSGDIFRSYNIDNGLSNNVVNGFMEDNAQNIWVATYGGGVIQYDGRLMTVFDEQDGLVDNKVYSLYQTRDGKIWIGTREGISIYENGTFTTFEDDEFSFSAVRKFFEDEETGDFWIATYNDGVYRISGNEIEQFDTGNYLQSNTVMDIKQDQSGDLWFATYGGAVRYDGEDFYYLTIADNLPSNGIIHIHIDHNNEIWFSTFNGPAIYRNGEVDRIIRTERIDTIFYFTIQDSQNRYWFGTNKGIYLFRKDLFDSHTSELERMISYRLYTQKQGLIANELNAGGSLLASDGTIWLGTVEGMSHFFPDRIDKNQTPPGIEFEEVMMSGHVIDPGITHQFLHDQNFLQATFSGLTYEAPEQIIYEYKLSGFEEDWQLTRENAINYPALPSGDFKLEIRAYNADGMKSSKTATLSFSILPPFYFQSWFFILVIIVIIGLILFWFRYFNVTKQVDIEKMRVQIASDLHDDVGSSLTELALQTDFLQTGEINPEVRSTLKQIGEHSRKIVSSLDDIVWSIDSRNDTAGDLTDRMQDYVNQIFINGLTEVFYHFDDLKMDQKLPVDVKENIYLIFKESVNNVVKHSNATKVDVYFSFDGKSFELQVKDNGTDSDNNRKSGQGLRNIAMRANRLRAEIKVEPENGFMVQVKGIIFN